MLNFKTTRGVFIAVLVLLISADYFYEIPFYAYILLIVLFLTTVIYGSFFVCSNFHIKTLCHGDRTQKEIAITFDDGPDEKTTAKILKVLKEHDATAAFFCIGKNAEKNPELLKQIVTADHILGNHTYNHTNFFDFYPAAKMKVELEKTSALFEKLTGKKVNLYRPLYGVTNPAVRKSAETMSYQVIGWSLRSLDTVIKNEQQLLNRVKRKLNPGDIILFHEGDPKIVSVLQEFLKYAKEKGYRFVGLDELLHVKPYS